MRLPFPVIIQHVLRSYEILIFENKTMRLQLILHKAAKN